MVTEKILEIISKVTPGTTLREGIFSILEAGRGGLIVVGINEEIKKMIDGGFYIDCDYTPEKIYELSKMDGAIIVDENIEKIYYANVHLHPDRSFNTNESGIRHRTAERMAIQTRQLVIAISERKKSVTLYKGSEKYRLKNISVVIEQGTQALETLAKYCSVLDKELNNLTVLELDDLVTIREVASVAQRYEMVYRIKKELKNYVIELGIEGRLISLQMQELLLNIKEVKIDFIKDYYNDEKEILDIRNINEELGKLSDSELLELERFAGILGHGKNIVNLDDKVVPKGYRILGKISKLNKKDIEKLVSIYENLIALQEGKEDEMSEIKGISKFKSKAIKNGLKRLKASVDEKE